LNFLSLLFSFIIFTAISVEYVKFLFSIFYN
jgi:hypothetical protein